MANRSDVFNETRLDTLYVNHAYLLLLQKEDWREYLLLLSQIYDLLEEENSKLPFDVLRAIAIKYYSQKNLQMVEAKVSQFFIMAIGELCVLRDSHDQFGQRYIETTRSGKELLRWMEDLLTQRVKFSGTGAETLLASLNNILVSRQQITAEEAIDHHREQIKSYQKDIIRIQQKGITHAELLPIPHSTEALFSQAEESAIAILASVEDVHSAIEQQRQNLALSYFEHSRTAGASINMIAEFYEKLYQSPEYSSYIQAKHLLSHLDAYSARFSERNIDHLLIKISQKELLNKDIIKKSHLSGFMSQFHGADESIQEKIKSQIKILQQQVHYALTTDMLGLQSSLTDILGSLILNREQALTAVSVNPLQLKWPVEWETGNTCLSDLTMVPDYVAASLDFAELEESERKLMLETLLQAEETTLQEVLNTFLTWIKNKKEATLLDYSFSHGLAEYYVLSEIQYFTNLVEQEFTGHQDLHIGTKNGVFSLRGASIYKYKLGE